MDHFSLFFFLMIRRPPRSTLFPYNDALPILLIAMLGSVTVLPALLSLAGDKVEFGRDRKSTRLNSSHMSISYAVFCLKKKKKQHYLFSAFTPIDTPVISIIMLSRPIAPLTPH